MKIFYYKKLLAPFLLPAIIAFIVFPACGSNTQTGASSPEDISPDKTKRLEDPWGFFEISYPEGWSSSPEDAAEIKSKHENLISCGILRNESEENSTEAIGIFVYSAAEYYFDVEEFNLDAILEYERNFYLESDDLRDLYREPEIFINDYNQTGSSIAAKDIDPGKVCKSITSSFLWMDTSGRIYIVQHMGCDDIFESDLLEAVSSFKVLYDTTTETVVPPDINP